MCCQIVAYYYLTVPTKPETSLTISSFWNQYFFARKKSSEMWMHHKVFEEEGQSAKKYLKESMKIIHHCSMLLNVGLDANKHFWWRRETIKTTPLWKVGAKIFQQWYEGYTFHWIYAVADHHKRKSLRQHLRNLHKLVDKKLIGFPSGRCDFPNLWFFSLRPKHRV